MAFEDHTVGPLSLRGGCGCGAVRFAVTGLCRPPIACHCEQCQRASGHYLSATQVSEDNLQVDGADNITWFQSSDAARRGFCRLCGSNLFWTPNDKAATSIMMGAIDRPHPPELALAGHIHCQDKANYYDIGDDGLPRYGTR